MNFAFSEEQELLRSEVRKLLDAQCPLKQVRELAATPEGYSPELWKQLGELGWLGLAIPEAHGGGATLIEQFILKEEMSVRRAPPLGSDFMGLTWVGPAIIEHGSEEQKQKFLPELLAGESVWCTGYSEPDSGSDLASLSTRAECIGDGTVIGGGTPNIQRNIIAERILGLPKD